MLANTHQALQPHTVTAQGVAVRSLPFTGETPVYTREEADSTLARKWRLLRHGGLLVAAMAGDRLAGSDQGTQAAVDFMQRNYGNARVVRLPVPPVWHLQQDQAGVQHTVDPQVLLVRGGAFAHANQMHTVGHYPVSA
jgi:hypothetical protein